MEIVAKENSVTIMDHREGKRTETFEEDPMVIPRRIMDKWKPQRLDELPEAFTGNAIFICLTYCSAACVVNVCPNAM